MTRGQLLTNSANEDIKRSTLDIRSTAKIHQLDPSLSVQDDILVLDIPMHDLGIDVKMSDSLSHLAKDLSTFPFFHGDAQLDVVE